MKVYDAWNSQQAHALCQLLEDHGISARAASDAIENLVGRVPFHKATCPIWVAADDADRARRVLLDYEKRMQCADTDKAQVGKAYCFHCGDAVQPEQTPCPKCGRELDWAE